MIDIKNLSFSYENANKPCLNDINIHVEKGEFIGIIGESGAGKTTLGRTINGIIPHCIHGDFYGSVKVSGNDTFEITPDKLSKIVGSVFQDIDSQMVASIVEDEILYGLENFGVPHDEIEERVSEALKRVGIENLRHRMISSLSGGQKQKVAIAAITAMKPEVLILDEPTGELDPKSSVQIFSMLKEMNETLGMTIIVIEQKIMLLCEFVKRLLVMQKGELIFDGDVRAVLKNSKQLEDMGTNIPRTVTLSNRLTEENLYSGEIALNIDEAKEMVGGIIKNG